MAKKANDSESKSVWAKPFEGGIEYEMSKEMAKALLATRKGADANLPPQKFLCQVVNAEFGVKGNCVRVLTI